MITEAAPLRHLRVVELSGGRGALCGRLLADLGAEVVLVEPPEGAPQRRKPPLHGNTSLHFATHHANKRGVTLDLESDTGKDQLLALISQADVLIDNLCPGELEGKGMSVEQLRQHHPGLVHLSLTDFGLSGPYRDFRGNNAVHSALAGVLARSGIQGSDPLLPPGDMAVEAAAIQAAWVVLLAVLKRGSDGYPNHLDFSLFEATAQVIDPGLGVTGSAAGGRTAAQLAQHGRPPPSPLYPIFPCADGHVRICVLNPRQWQAMSAWLGENHPFTKPEYASLDRRLAEITEINALIGVLFAKRTAGSLVAEGQQRGVPIARLASPGEVLSDEHFAARNAFTDCPLPDGGKGRMASGFLEIDDQRYGPRRVIEPVGIETLLAQWSTHPMPPRPPQGPPVYRPLDGVRVLDLGVIVAGAELGRLLADQGAQVIKVETSSYPDGLRQSYRGDAVSPSFAQGSRGKLSFGLNLRSRPGLELFLDLVRHSDIVLSNFKPGTMESLGLGYEALAAVNPGIITADSSALGRSGPRSRSMGYGPLVRAATALSGLWRYPESAGGGFSDGITIYPDHFAARVSAVGIAALLYRRQRTGQGGTVSVSQAECILNAMACEFLRESVTPGSLRPRGNTAEFDAPGNLFPCAGDDQWCAIYIEGDEDFQRLAAAIGLPHLAGDAAYQSAAKRCQERAVLEAKVSAWTEKRSADGVMYILQAHGVPAGSMYRVEELENNVQLQRRQFLRKLVQPELSQPMLTVNGPVSWSMLPDPEIRPAPRFGQHTRQLAREVLGLEDCAIDTLFADGVLEGE